MSSATPNRAQDDAKPNLPSLSHDVKQVEVGIQGVQLKHFERVVKKLLTAQRSTDDGDQQDPKPLITIDYSNLPLPPSHGWPFDRLPSAARVWGTQRGQLSNQIRAQRKEDQSRCMLSCVMALLDHCGISTTNSPAKESTDTRTTTIVDFGGGSGHLAIPLALLLPFCRIVVVDLSQRALDLLHEKAQRVPPTNGQNNNDEESIHENSHGQEDPLTSHSQIKACTNIPNLYTFHGPVEAYNELPVDLGIALHLCGQATDVALRRCAAANARAMVMCPCCVGKLNPTRLNPYVWQATGQNQATVQYPQSSPFAKVLAQSTDWNALAKAADYSDADTCRSTRNATRRCAKALLETDRRLFLENTFGYQTALTRMEPWEATPKNDILLAWKPSDQDLLGIWGSNQACLEDIATTKAMLMKTTQNDNSISVEGRGQVKPTEKDPHSTHSVSTPQPESCNELGTTSSVRSDANDWSAEEEGAIRQDIQNFLSQASDKDDAVLVFPTGMGRRKRRLIHFVAANCDLAHWSLQHQENNDYPANGKNKSGSKTVAVARRRVALRRSHEDNPNVHLLPIKNDMTIERGAQVHERMVDRTFQS